MMSPRSSFAAAAALTGAAFAAFVMSTPEASSGFQAKEQADATGRIVAAAQDVVRVLDATGRQKVQFAFGSPQTANWSNLPTPIFQRTGVRLSDLSSAQRAAVMKLLTTALSKEGYQKVVDIMHGDEVLKQTSGGRGPGPNAPGGLTFGEGEYFLAFVGTPSTTTPWMLQFGGHHLAINLTLAGSEASMTPSLPAVQPATYTLEGRTVRPLGDENDKAFALINALDAKQRSQAILPSRVADLVLGPGQDGRKISPEGIRASALTAQQQVMLWDVVHEWTGIPSDAFAGPRLTEIKSHLNDTYFAWSGATTNGSAAYFRIQGPTLVIEYAPQQGSVDHVHTIYRDPTNDYGARIAKR